jgi:hypothetical protein
MMGVREIREKIVDRIHLDQGREHWRTFVNTCSMKGGEFLD